MSPDIFSLLQASSLPTPTQNALPVLSLWQTAVHYVMFFTLVPEVFASHYEEAERCYYLCLGDGCPACTAGIRATEHVYLPVWDAQTRRVAVLKFDTREDGPRVKILAFLTTYREQLAEVVAVINCDGKGKGEFSMVAHAPLPETDRGALACQAFVQALDAGTVNLRRYVKQFSADEIAKLPTVRSKLTPVVDGMVLPANAKPLVGAPVDQPSGRKEP